MQVAPGDAYVLYMYFVEFYHNVFLEELPTLNQIVLTFLDSFLISHSDSMGCDRRFTAHVDARCQKTPNVTENSGLSTNNQSYLWVFTRLWWLPGFPVTDPHQIHCNNTRTIPNTHKVLASFAAINV